MVSAVKRLMGVSSCVNESVQMQFRNSAGRASNLQFRWTNCGMLPTVGMDAESSVVFDRNAERNREEATSDSLKYVILENNRVSKVQSHFVRRQIEGARF